MNINNLRNKMRFFLLVIFLTYTLFAQENIKIGVLAKRGAEITHKKFNATAQYLSKEIPDINFEIVAIDFDDIFKAVKNKDVSFILTNPGFYVELEYRYGVQRIATLVNKHISGYMQKEFGGVIFTHISNKNRFKSLNDIRGASLSAVNKRSLGGWQMAWREILEKGIDIDDDLKQVSFEGTHDNVVYSVLNKQTDIGTVRTDTLERMSKEGKIDLDLIYVINAKKYEDFPFLVSTKLYPEWPFAKLKNISDELAKKVAIALMKIKPSDEAAYMAKIAGWNTPLSYQPVHECFKALKISPYYHNILVIDVVKKYWLWIIFYTFLAISGISMFLYQLRLTKNLKNTQNELVQTEKMASLGRLVAGVAHEINTPLGVSVTASSHLNMIVKKFQQDYESNTLSKSSFESFVEAAKKSSELILGNLEKAAELIRNFKQISVDQISDQNREFYLKEYIQSIINSLSPELKKKKHEVKLSCDEKLFIYSNAGALAQIFTNLIMNSIIHGFENKEKGTILIDIKKIETVLHIVYKDDGIGVSKKNISKLFDPFFTTKRGSGGSGLGTSIIYNLITQTFHGDITVDLKQDHGLEFIISLKDIKYI